MLQDLKHPMVLESITDDASQCIQENLLDALMNKNEMSFAQIFFVFGYGMSCSAQTQ